MSRSLTYTWPVSNTTDVCNQQSTAGAANLVLNGNLANQTNTAVPFINYGYARTVVISYTAPVGALTFTINGTQNGVNISEQLPVAAVNTPTESINSFDIITSISAPSLVTNVTVGSGYNGFFNLLNINLERDVINYSVSFNKLTATSLNTFIYGGLSNIGNNGKTFLNIVANDKSLFSIKGTGIVDQYIFPAQNSGILAQPLYKFILIKISGDNTTGINSIQLNFIQT